MGGIFVVAAVACLNLVVRVVARHRKRMGDAWGAAASQLGLECQPGGLFTSPRLFGERDGVLVEVNVQSATRSDSTVTRYEVTHEPTGPPMELLQQNAFTWWARLFGKADVEVGDPFFDDRVVVDSRFPDAIRAFLTPARQAVVLELFDRWRYGQVTERSIVVETMSVEREANKLIENVVRLVAMAQTMSDPGRVEVALERQRDGDLADAIDEWHRINDEQSNIFTQTLEAEALVEVGEHEQAAMIFDRIDEKLPAGSERQGWDRLASSPSPPPPPVELPRPVSLPAPVVGSGVSESAVPAPLLDVDQRTVIEDLFNSGRLSYEIVERFEQRYVNTQVRWTGTVTGYHDYRHDGDFGEGPGIKVTVLLGSSGSQGLLSNEVHAMVQLQSSSTVKRGSTIEFVGTLVRIDRFSRKFYVAAANLS